MIYNTSNPKYASGGVFDTTSAEAILTDIRSIFSAEDTKYRSNRYLCVTELDETYSDEL